MFPDSKAEYYRILSVLELEWEKKREYASSRDFHALSFRIKGNAVFEHNKEKFEVGAGEIAFVPKGFDYTLDSRESEHLYVIHFDMLPEKAYQFSSFTTTNTAYFEELFKKICRIWQRKETGYRLAATSVFYQMLEEIVKEKKDKTSESGKDRLSEVVEYIHRHYADPTLTVTHLAERYGASTTYFRRVFNASYKTTPLKYINKLRLKRAEELLYSGYYSVSEAAYASGFTDPKYFSRFIKKEKGLTPTKLRYV